VDQLIKILNYIDEKNSQFFNKLSLRVYNYNKLVIETCNFFYSNQILG
jgi:hypothetical protein